MSLTTQIVILIILLFLSGLSSGSEVALVSLSKAKVRHLLERKVPSATYIKKLKDDTHRMLGTILIMNNLVNVGAAALTTSVMIELMSSYAVGIATGIMTFLILVFGEITPKSIAAKNNVKFSKIVAAPIWYLSIVFYPFLFILEKFIVIFMRLLGMKTEEPIISEEEIIHMVEHAEEEGSIREIEKDLIGNIFDFDDIQVKEIMIPKKKMDILKATTTVKGAMKVFLRHAHSRMPVYDKRENNIVGMVFIKDLVKHFHEGKNVQVKKIMHKPYFIHERKRISGLLRIFQKAGRSHMALVVNQYGRVTGLVTMEDVLEEIVGEIMDETDKILPHVDKITRNTWMVDGDTDLDELKDRTGLSIPEGKYDTFGEFIVKLNKRLPKKGNKITYRNFTFSIEEVAKKKIEKVKVTKS
tara:strand:- start:2829 stop:4067 length:1239 start_codon:yes stop_codon:yes gene_type:complete